MVRTWQNLVLAPGATLRQALKVIDQGAIRMALVATQGRLIGTVSDGDIRRGLLAGMTLECAIDEVVHRQPVTVSADCSREQAVRLMEQKWLLALPIVEEGILLGVHALHELLEQPHYGNPVFIMAGGFGTRLRPLTEHCPKPMLKVGDRPLLETLLRSFIERGFTNFYISTHYLPEVIQSHFGDGSQWGVSITYVHEQAPLGTGGALALLPEERPALPVVMINGDILTNLKFDKLVEHHNAVGADATLCVREFEYQIPYGVINSRKGNVVEMQEKPVERYQVNAGIYVLSDALVRSVVKGQRVDMPTLLEQRLEQGEEVSTYTLHDYWLDIGQMADFERAQRDIKGLFAWVA
ncbi:nucleotidyltransferase family protein [Ferrimonas marina]|uniref:CBS domain-containing protein n=1 Tax=Ferrimonas marina TaxID=299255 RepID=A0A1M5QVA9_9GAMM|nr:nucleotidyltransferase family protein [Ferrimonas marina]SHH17639.1 CBS domain-containing protein [Ferrimonas marina]